MNTLTKEEQTKILDDLFKAFHRRGELLLPDTELYPEVFDSKSIEQVAKKVFVWLGTKPKGLDYAIHASNSGYRKLSDSKHIYVPARYASKPYIGTAIIVKACLEHLLSIKKIRDNPEIVEEGLIELGFGLIIINSFDGDDSLRSRINLFLHMFNAKTEALEVMSTHEFATKFTDFITTNKLDAKVILEHTVPRVKAYLPLKFHQPGKLMLEPYVQKESKARDVFRVKVMGFILCVVSVTIFFAYLYSMQPRRISVELQLQKDKIAVLRSSYVACTRSLKNKQDEYTKDDIFLDRQLDAHNSRCESIKNKHDFNVQEFNQKLSEQGF